MSPTVQFIPGSAAAVYEFSGTTNSNFGTGGRDTSPTIVPSWPYGSPFSVGIRYNNYPAQGVVLIFSSTATMNQFVANHSSGSLTWTWEWTTGARANNPATATNATYHFSGISRLWIDAAQFVSWANIGPTPADTGFGESYTLTLS